MISNNARDGFDHLLIQALKTSMVPSPEYVPEITVLNDPSEITESKLVMLTISSYLFRLVVFIYFTPDEATKEHFAKINNMQASEMSEQSFYDVIAEYGNICCGTLSRDLGPFFPYRGMSTPNVIDKDCSAHLDVLGFNYIKHFTVSSGDSRPFHVSLCICDYADLDFVVDVNEFDSSTGELELF